jgi:hypothetical protein
MNIDFWNRGSDTGYGRCYAWIIAILVLVFFFTDLDDCFKSGK